MGPTLIVLKSMVKVNKRNEKSAFQFEMRNCRAANTGPRSGAADGRGRYHRYKRIVPYGAVMWDSVQ